MSPQNPSSYPCQVTPHLLHLGWISTAGTILKLGAQEHELQVGSDSVKVELLCHTCPAITSASLPHSLISLHHSHSLCDLAHRRWTTLPATAACYQSPRQGELRMSWVHACETDRWPCCHPADLSCFLPLTSLGFQVPLPTPASGTFTSVLFLYSTCGTKTRLEQSLHS